MIFLLDSCGDSMIFLLDFYVIAMGLPWDFYDASMKLFLNFKNDFYEFSIVFAFSNHVGAMIFALK